MGVELRAENENANPTNRVKGNMNPPSMRPKCALDEPPTSPVASLKRERSSSWHLDAHVASSAAARGRVDVKIDGRRTGDAIKTRRLSETHKESCAQVDDRLLYLLSGSVTPGRRVFRRDVGVVTTAVPDSKAIRNQELKSAIMQKREIEEEKVPCALQDSEGPFVISPHRRQNEMSGRQRSVFGGDERQDKITSTAPLNASMSALPAMQKVSPFMHQRVPAGSPDMSPIRNQELKSPIKQKREIEEEKVPSNPALPSLLPSLEASGQEKVNGDDSDVSRDVSEFEVAYSQEKLDDLSIKECDMTEAVVLSLCGKLAKSLSKAERDRMEQANLLTIPLAEEQSPIVLGRDQFQDVFGDNIHGGMISHLSRRHCLIRVHNVPSRDDSARESIKVMIEDTSTNGIRVNDTQLKKGQAHELNLGDIVTLWRFHQNEVDVTLEYMLARSYPQPAHSPRKSRESRPDGQSIRPSDNFFRELAASSDSENNLPPDQKSDVTTPRPQPPRAIAQDMRHRIPAVFFSFAKAPSWTSKALETSKPNVNPEKLSE